jgi:hypothetical protein
MIDRHLIYRNTPFDHWIMTNTIPMHLLKYLQLIDKPTLRKYDKSGIRAGSASTLFFDSLLLDSNPLLKELSTLFAHGPLLMSLQHVTETSLHDTHIRISLCRDYQEFWLSPHTDLSVKLVTIILYVSSPSSSSNLGTDLYDDHGQISYRVPFRTNSALVFKPSSLTLHGFERTPFDGERRTLVINYVTDGWNHLDQLTGLRVSSVENIRLRK